MIELDVARHVKKRRKDLCHQKTHTLHRVLRHGIDEALKVGEQGGGIDAQGKARQDQDGQRVRIKSVTCRVSRRTIVRGRANREQKLDAKVALSTTEEGMRLTRQQIVEAADGQQKQNLHFLSVK